MIIETASESVLRQAAQRSVHLGSQRRAIFSLDSLVSDEVRLEVLRPPIGHGRLTVTWSLCQEIHRIKKKKKKKKNLRIGIAMATHLTLAQTLNPLPFSQCDTLLYSLLGRRNTAAYSCTKLGVALCQVMLLKAHCNRIFGVVAFDIRFGGISSHAL